MKRWIYTAVLVALIAAPRFAYGAVITDVQSSFDKDDPFDIRLTLAYETLIWNSLITRERLGPDKRLVAANKMEFNRSQSVFHFGTAIGLYHDMELVFDLPYVVSDQAELGLHPDLFRDPECAGDPYANCAGDIDAGGPDQWVRGPDKPPLIDLPFKGAKRKGLGDIGVGFRWAPWHYKRDKAYPSWLVGLILRLPSAKVKKATNNAVGEGLFQIEMNTAVSRRVASFFEAYFDLHGVLKFATSSSLFQIENPETQTLVQPGHQMGLTGGVEFIPWEVEGEERHVSIYLSGGVDYVFEGREYTELFEGLGNSPCRPSRNCDDTTYTRYLKEVKDGHDPAYVNDKLPRTDGITDVEHRGIFSFAAGLDVQPIKYLQLQVDFNMGYITPHFLTFADAGKDSPGDSDSYVTESNSEGKNEYNPKYLESVDEVGHRFRASRSYVWSLLFSMSGRF